MEILGIRKSQDRLVLTLKKDKFTLEKLVKLLEHLGFKKFESNKIRSLMGDADNNYSAKEYSNELYQDALFDLESDKYQIEIIFGSKKVFIIAKSNNASNIQKIIDSLK